MTIRSVLLEHQIRATEGRIRSAVCGRIERGESNLSELYESERSRLVGAISAILTIDWRVGVGCNYIPDPSVDEERLVEELPCRWGHRTRQIGETLVDWANDAARDVRIKIRIVGGRVMLRSEHDEAGSVTRRKINDGIAGL